MIKFTRGDTFKFKFVRKDKYGSIITDQADEVWFTVKANYTTETKEIQKTLSDGITFSNDGYYHVELEPADTKNLNYQKYVYDIQIDNNGIIKTLDKGYFELTEEVTFEGGE